MSILGGDSGKSFVHQEMQALSRGSHPALNRHLYVDKVGRSMNVCPCRLKDPTVAQIFWGHVQFEVGLDAPWVNGVVQCARAGML